MVIITAEVQDPVKWEARFRTHVDLFRSYDLRAPVHFTMAGKEVAACFQPKNLDSFREAIESQASVESMAFDGVKPDTVQMFVLDKQIEL
jgi:hypothetical protein